MYIYIYIHTYTYIYTYTCAYIYIYIYTRRLQREHGAAERDDEHGSPAAGVGLAAGGLRGGAKSAL